jgi:hypothetical protein
MPKTLIESKTFWVNLLTGAIAVGGYLTGVIPAQYQPYLIGGLAIANIVLRLITGQPIDKVA